MAVRAAIPWYLRWLGLIALAVAVLLLSRAAYDYGKQFAGFDQDEVEVELRRLSERNLNLEKEVAQLRGEHARNERNIQMERATHADLVKQMKTLSEENAVLKEDLAFFQTLMPSGGKDGGVAVSRFLVQNENGPGEYRYRLLLTQTGQRSKDFQGHLELTVSLQQDNRKSVIALPGEDDKDSKGFQVNFRFYQRVEGTFRVPPNAVVKSVQLRVFEQGNREPRLIQTVNIS